MAVVAVVDVVAVVAGGVDALAVIASYEAVAAVGNGTLTTRGEGVFALPAAAAAAAAAAATTDAAP